MLLPSQVVHLGQWWRSQGGCWQYHFAWPHQHNCIGGYWLEILACSLSWQRHPNQFGIFWIVAGAFQDWAGKAWLLVPLYRLSGRSLPWSAKGCTGLFSLMWLLAPSISIDPASVSSPLSANFATWILAESVEIPALVRYHSRSSGFINPVHRAILSLVGDQNQQSTA